METNSKQKKKRYKGFLVLEPAIIMVLFIFVFSLANNGVVSLARNEWHNAAKAGATAGMQKFVEQILDPGGLLGGILGGGLNVLLLQQNMLDEAKLFAQMHSWSDGPIQEGQVDVTLGTWVNCTFTPGLGGIDLLDYIGLDDEDLIPLAVRVDIIPPTNEQGNPTGMTQFFGRIHAPFLQKIPETVTAVASLSGTTVILVEYEGQACNQIIPGVL